MKSKVFATNIEWDTNGEDFINDEITDLPTIVEIPSGVDSDAFADYLSDEYGFCVFGFDIEEVYLFNKVKE
jgi:hypothetical protein